MARKTIWSELFLNPEHIELTLAARDFSQKEIEPLAAAIDKNHKIPTDLIQKMGELGFLGMGVPAEWGGSGFDTLSYISVLEEISVACASSSVLMSVNNSLVCTPLKKFGTKEQKDKYLGDLARGKRIGCYCLSEPGSGSDAGAMKTRAVKKGNKWVINGVKNFITNGKEASVAIVYTNSNPELKNKSSASWSHLIIQLEETPAAYKHICTHFLNLHEDKNIPTAVYYQLLKKIIIL